MKEMLDHLKSTDFNPRIGLENFSESKDEIVSESFKSDEPTDSGKGSHIFRIMVRGQDYSDVFGGGYTESGDVANKK